MSFSVIDLENNYFFEGFFFLPIVSNYHQLIFYNSVFTLWNGEWK